MTASKPEPLIPTNITGMLCPNCEYDLRGVVEPVCPECGRSFTVAEVVEYAGSRWRHDRLFRQLSYLPLCWCLLYMLLPNDLFSGTVDRIDVEWFKWFFLNIPLQLALWAIAATLLASRRRARRRGGALVLLAVPALIAVHIVASLATAW